MALVDPARAKKRTKEETRRMMQDECRKEPCSVVAKGDYPTCVVCVHEGKLFKNDGGK
jgi:hypothetical protein